MLFFLAYHCRATIIDTQFAIKCEMINCPLNLDNRQSENHTISICTCAHKTQVPNLIFRMRYDTLWHAVFALLTALMLSQQATGSDILMITMGGTKSHKIPFWELARGLIVRQHNVTFLNGFLADFQLDGLHEITPAGLVNYIQNYTQDWDLVGARMRGDLPISLWDAIRYPLEVIETRKVGRWTPNSRVCLVITR